MFTYMGFTVPFVKTHFNQDLKVCDDGSIIDLLDINPSSSFFIYLLKSNIPETGFCLRPQVKAYSVGPYPISRHQRSQHQIGYINKTQHLLIGTNRVGFYLRKETESCL
jgi:hypothetical protein